MIGSVVSHYKILEKLGEGGMGVVYEEHVRGDVGFGRNSSGLYFTANEAL